MPKISDIHYIEYIHCFTHIWDGVKIPEAVLLSAAFDNRLGLIDVRQPKQAALAAFLWSQWGHKTWEKNLKNHGKMGKHRKTHGKMEVYLLVN